MCLGSLQSLTMAAAAPASAGVAAPPHVVESPERAAARAQDWAARRQALAMRMIVVAELLHILRPVVYTLALRRCGPLRLLPVQCGWCSSWNSRAPAFGRGG